MAEESKNRPALDVRKFDEAVGQAVAVANKSKQAETNYPPEYRFMQLTDQLCEAMMEAARQQLTLAENNMKTTEQQTAKLKAEAKRRWEEHDAYVRGLEDFGMTILDASKKFQRGNGR